MLTLATIAGLFVAAWPPAVPETLRECLIASGFEIAASVAGGPDLDRRLTSSECAASGDQFVAAFYFADEITGQRLGPFHLATYDKRQGRWTYRPDIDAELEKNGFERGGSALEITIADAFILIETHSTPSANYQLVVDRRLTPLASFCGFHSEVAGRLVFYKGCMVHVAATHQQRLLVFDLRDRQQREIFPGRRSSPFRIAFVRDVRNAFQRQSAARRRELEQSQYPIGGYDRSLDQLIVANEGRRLAMIAYYSAGRLEGAPRGEAVVSCARAAAEWRCEERPAAQLAAAHHVEIRRHESGRIDQDSARALVQAALSRPPTRRP